MSRFLRRAHRLRVGDQIRTEGGLFARNHIAALEPCDIDGSQRIRVEFPDHDPLYLGSNDLIKVLYQRTRAPTRRPGLDSVR
jgi:hypothetical protein